MEVVVGPVGCAADRIPFLHLSVPVGQNMCQVAALEGVISRFIENFSFWKANTLSIGGV